MMVQRYGENIKVAIFFKRFNKMEDKNRQKARGTALSSNNMTAKQGKLEITSEMIDNAQTVGEVERYRVEILAYRNETLKRFRTYGKLSIGQQKFLSYLKCLRIQCHHRIVTLSEITPIERDIISCAFMRYAKEELSEEQYARIYVKALEKVGKNIQNIPVLSSLTDESLNNF